MPDLCHEPHPDHPEVTCIKEAPCTGYHIAEDGQPWGYTPVESKARKQTRIQGIVERAKKPVRTGPPTSVPQEVEEAWQRDQGQWLKQAQQTFREFLVQRRSDFTTPEHFWPLVDSPPQRRAFSLVVQQALRENWIVEVGAVRLRGTYETRDGQQFAMNKLVPVYRSQLQADE